jgi:hypothetical protein
LPYSHSSIDNSLPKSCPIMYHQLHCTVL